MAVAGGCSPICPTFVLPYKRYASPSLLPLVQTYLENDQQSYQATVAPRGRVIGYTTPAGQTKVDERALHRSTLWRWIGWLGVQTVALQHGHDLWMRHDFQSTLHRFVGAVSPRKYRSQRRDEILRTARRLLHLIDRWDRTFAEKFFPRFATRSRVP